MHSSTLLVDQSYNYRGTQGSGYRPRLIGLLITVIVLLVSGQFWGRSMLGQSLPPDLVQGGKDKEMTIFHQSQLKRFYGSIYGSWASRNEMCFHAGDRQGGRVILGSYHDYEVETAYSTEFRFSMFMEEWCLRTPVLGDYDWHG